jgi:WD40 repeat protein
MEKVMKRNILLMLCVICWLIGMYQISFGQKPELVAQTGHTGRITAISYSPGGAIIASASEDNTIKLWDTKFGIPIRTFSANSSFSPALVFSSDGKMLAFGGMNGTIKVWDIALGKILHNFQTDQTPKLSLAFGLNDTNLL